MRPDISYETFLKENKIVIDLERDKLFDEYGRKRFKDAYLRDSESSPQERFAYVSWAFSDDDDHAQRLYDYSSQHYLSYATPVLTFGKDKNNLPISCYLSLIPDTRQGLVDTMSEVSWLSMLGGGVGIHPKMRSSDDKSVGIMPHLKSYDANSLAFRQGRTRRGSFAPFLDIDHPDIIQFIEMRKPTGDYNQRALNLHHGINISDKFMNLIERCMVDANVDDSWELIDPHSKQVKEVVSAKGLWQQIIELRMQTGEPYLFFIDSAREKLPIWQKLLGLDINGSNICVEITLATDEERTAVCALSSVNLEYYHIIRKIKGFIADAGKMMSNVLDVFNHLAPDSIKRAKYSAFRERSIGLGALGFHALLQQMNLPFNSPMAKGLNRQIFKWMREEMWAVDKELCKTKGSCPDAAEMGYERHFSHWLALAPNASTSILMGNTSPSIEPYRAVIFRQDTLSGSNVLINKYFDQLCKAKNLDVKNYISSIIENDGSVQHLDFLSDWEKEVFKTAIEIDQVVLVELAADRQEFICQSQSLNLFFKPDVNIAYLSWIHYLAWKKKLKSLYYCRSQKLQNASSIVGDFKRVRIEEIENQCFACEG